MGFELDKLMKQYGVSTPTVATYTGTAAPTTPPVATATQADKDAFAEQTRKYNLDQNAYNQYKQQYQDRMQAGSQYGPPTTAAKIVNPTYGAVGLNMQGMSDADRQAYYNSQRKLGYTIGDLKANAEKTFGVGSVADPNWNGWESQYNPNYVPPAGPIVATGYTPPVTTTTTGTTGATDTPDGSYAGQYFDPNDPNNPYYHNARGGSIHALAAKYRNGGPVKTHYKTAGAVNLGNYNYDPAKVAASDSPSWLKAVIAQIAQLPPKAEQTPNITSPAGDVNAEKTPRQVSSAIGYDPAVIISSPATPTTGTYNAPDTFNGSYDSQYFDPNNPNWAYTEQYNEPSNPFYGHARHNSIHALAAKYRNGGPVKRHYDDGGNVDFGADNPANLPTMASPVAGVPSMDAIAAATRAAPMPQAAPVAPAAVDPNAMLASAVRSRTLPETTKAFSDYDAAQKAVMDSLRQQGAEKISNGPSKAETYFKLAAAFAEPGKTGSFGEGLGRAAGVMGDYQKAARESDIANAMAKRSLQNEMLKYQAQSAEKALEQRVKIQDTYDQANKMPAKMQDFIAYNSMSPTQQKAFREMNSNNPALPALLQEFDAFKNMSSGDQALYKQMRSTAAVAPVLSGNALDTVAEQVRLTGKIPAGFTRNLAQVGAIWNRAAELAALDGDDAKSLALRQQSLTSDQGSLKDLTKKTDAIEAFENTAKKNLDMVVRAANELNFEEWPVVNEKILQGKKLTGDSKAAKLYAAIIPFVDEYGKILSGATGAAGATDSSKAEAASLIAPYMTAETINELAPWFKEEMGNRTTSLYDQLDTIQARMGGGKRRPPKEANSPAAASLPAGIPAGSKIIGKTPDGKDVYQDTTGKKWVE